MAGMRPDLCDRRADVGGGIKESHARAIEPAGACAWRRRRPEAVALIRLMPDVGTPSLAVPLKLSMHADPRTGVARAGGEERLSVPQLRQAVLEGAVQRLRPKLLTECTTVLGLAPMLWASGPGAEIIRPMALPVLGGILLADEVIDLLLPVLFF